MKIVFFGTPEFALSSAEACREAGELLAVVTQPDRPRGRGQKLSPCPVRQWAQDKGIPNFAPASLKKESPELSELHEFLKDHAPELFVVTAYGNLLPETLINLPPNGSINLHGSLLPKWRGAAPIQRSIEAGDIETGVCLQKMVFELDAGDVLSESSLDIDLRSNVFDLSERMASTGKLLLLNFLKKPNWQGSAQDPSEVSYAKKMSKEEGHWSADWGSLETHNRVRAFVAWPGVVANWQGKALKILETEVVSTAEAEEFAQANPSRGAGALHFWASRVFLECGPRQSTAEIRTCEFQKIQPGILELLQVQAAGKAAVLAPDYFRNFLQNSDSLDKTTLKLESL
ncbi:methionyl-tRNA formyltransferase [bacterium]|nr:methionyl-tRNA formyltransferase [bacterium]